MRRRAVTSAVAGMALVAVAPSLALAHGGAYQPPGPGGRGADSGGQVPPGTSDPPAARRVVTRWEAWWAANKEHYLRLHERMRQPPGTTGGVTTPRDGDGDSIDTAKQDQADADAREALVGLFIEALGDGYFDVRTAAAIALGKTEDARGLKPLMKSAKEDDHKEVREAATLGLGLLGNEGAVPFLDILMNDRKANDRQRAFAAFSLGLIGGDDSASSLLRFLDPNAGPRSVSGNKQSGPLQASVFVALGLTGHERAKSTLRDALESKRYDDTVKGFVVLSLGRLKDRDSLDRLTEMLRKEKDGNLRRSAAIALGKIVQLGDAEALETLHRALTNDNDPVTRHFAAISLGTLAREPGAGAVRTRLRKRFPQSDLMDRPFVALSLGIAGDVGSAPMLRKALEQAKDESEAGSLCLALALLGDQQSATLLEERVKRKGKVWLQSYAAIGLGMIGHRPSIPLLEEKLDNSNESRIRMNMGVALGLLHAPKAGEYFTKTMKGDGTLYERSSAAMSLAVLRITSAMPDLVALYRDKKEKDMVRAFAVVALGVLADPAPFPKLARIAIDHNYSVSVDPLDEVLSIL